MKKTLTYSTQSISKSCFAILGKSRLSILPAWSARWNDHSANEILNKDLFSSATARSAAPRVNAAPAAAVDCRNVRRSSEFDMAGTSQEYGTEARSITR